MMPSEDSRPRKPLAKTESDEMIKHLGPAARRKLLELFNQSWKTGIFPSAWKEATIIPIRKKEKDPAKKTSYRPISLLSCLGKTLERMINKRLMWHLESNNLITKEQTAFRKNRSTEDQLVYLAQSIENAFQEKKKVVATFIDLSKAFDKVWKDGLLLKLLTAGIAGRMFNWIKSFPVPQNRKSQAGQQPEPHSQDQGRSPPGRGNEEADRLAKSGSRKEQPQQAVSYTEAKTL
nr:hypothetical protein BaRGS_012751 [Batillaria attramentaria]